MGEGGKPDNLREAGLASLIAGTVKSVTGRHDTCARVPLHFMVEVETDTVEPLLKDQRPAVSEKLDDD